MHYEVNHACPNDHVIYYNQHEFATECLEGSSQGSLLYSHHSTFATIVQVQKHGAIYGLPCQEQKSR